MNATRRPKGFRLCMSQIKSRTGMDSGGLPFGCDFFFQFILNAFLCQLTTVRFLWKTANLWASVIERVHKVHMIQNAWFVLGFRRLFVVSSPFTKASCNRSVSFSNRNSASVFRRLDNRLGINQHNANASALRNRVNSVNLDPPVKSMQLPFGSTEVHGLFNPELS